MPRRPGRCLSALAVLAVACGLVACRTQDPQPTPDPERPASPAMGGANQAVPPTLATTNDLNHVTYTFNLPRPAVGGYIIQESTDGMSWTDLGRSTSTNFTRVTFVDSMPSRGRRYRVILP